MLSDLSRKNELGEIYEIYMTAAKNTGKPPKQLSDLNRKAAEGISPGVMQKLQGGQYVIVWGTAVGTSGAVLAYDRHTIKQDGPVLMADGRIKNKCADELQAATKAKG